MTKAKKKGTFGQQLIESAREAVQIERGEREAARITRYTAAEAEVEPPPQYVSERIKEIREQEWAGEVASFKPAICHFEVFLGFEGDIARHGATRSNHWFYESWDTDEGIWAVADGGPIPMMFASFPSLKDPEHDPGPSNRHTGQAMVWADWSSVAEFADREPEERAAEWTAFKQDVEAKLMEFYAEKFPALAPLVVYRELGTPLATAAFTRHEKGGFYGVETTPRRLLSDALAARTPVPGLFLTGQDVMTPGIAGALAGGMLGAAAIDPRVYRKFVW